MKIQSVKIGQKNIINYISAVVMSFQEHETIDIRAVGTSINIMERVVKLMTTLGINEVGRRTEKDGDVEVLVVTLCRKKK